MAEITFLNPLTGKRETAQKVSSVSSYGVSTPDKSEQTYTITTKDKQYTIGQKAIDWIRNRYVQSFDGYYAYDDEDQLNKSQGYMPRSFQKGYGNNDWDRQLLDLGLPSSKYLNQYLEEYYTWYGDGQYYQPDKEESSYIKSQAQKHWTYTNSPEDLQRKIAGQMPVKEEAKYKDKNGNFLSYQDEMYFSMGLPPSSEMYNYSYMYGDYVNKTNRVNEFYGAAAADVVNELLIKGIKNDDTLYTQEDGKTVTGKDLWEQEYYRFINSSDEWADIRSWVQPDEEEDVFTPKPEWSTKQAEEERMAWQAKQDAKAAAADDSYLIDPDYDDFLTFFRKNAEKVYTQKIAYDAGAGFESELTYEDYIENEYEQNVRNMYAGITDEKSLDNFLDEVSDEKNYAQTITNLKDYGVSKKLIRKAKNKLIDKTEDEGVQQAIKDAFDAPTIIKVTDDMLDRGIGLPRRAGKVSGRDAVFDKKLETFTEALQTRAESDDISTQAVDAYYAALEYDEYNRVTVESAERGLDAALAAGATPNTIRKIVAEFDERFAVGDPNTIVSGTAFLSSYANGVIEQAEVKLIKDAIPAFRVSLAEQGASQFEIDQALRRAGYGEYLEDGESAYNYFVSKGYTQFVDELQMEELSEQPVEVQRAFAQQMWEALPAEERQAYVANFGETQMVNPEIHKNVMDSVKDYVSGRFIDNLVLGLASGTVSFADMAVGKFTGSTKEQWEITKTLGDMYTWSRSYGKSETQGGGMGAFNFATTVSDELLRMSVLGKVGGLVGKGATAVTSKIPALAKATSALNLTSDIAKEMSKNTSGIGKYGFSATSKFARGVANVVSGASLSRAPFITNAMGSYFNEAMSFTDENGNPPSRRDATTYAFWCGLLEGIVESFNVDTWASKALGSKKLAGIVANGCKGYTRASLTKRAIASHLIASAAGEFGEESLSYAASCFMQRQTYNPDAEFDWGEFIESGGMGAVIGLLGASMHAGSYSASGIIYNYMENNGFDADFFDLLHVATQVEALPQKNYEQNSEATEWLPLEEYKSVQRDLASHARQLESSKQNYNAARGKIDAEVQLKVDAVEALRGRIQALNDGRLTPEKAKELGGLMESLRVAESELSTERAQAENKLSELQSAYKETTAQHRAAIEKAQAKVDAHNVAMYNFFLPDIASMRGMSAAQLQQETAAKQQANSEAILQGAYRSETFYEGMFDEMDAASEDAAIAYSNLAQAEETLAATAGTVDSVRKKISRLRQTNKAAYEAGVAEAQTQTETATQQAETPAQQAQTQTAEQTQAQQPAAAESNYYELSDDDMASITSLASLFKRTVAFSDSDTYDGYYSGDGVLHISRKQAARYRNHPELVVFVHELTHSIETSKYYNEFSEAAIQYARNAFVPTEQFPTFEAKYNDFARAVAEGRARNGYQTTEEDVRRDFVATFASERMFSDPDAVRAMAKTNSNLVSRVYNQIRYWLHNFFPSGEGSRAEQDLRQLERLYAMALHEAKVKPSEDVRQFMTEASQFSTGATWDDYFAEGTGNASYSTGISWDDLGSQYGVHEQGMNPRVREIAVPVSTDGTDRTSLFLRTALESSNVTDESVRSIVSAVEQEQFGTYAPQSDAKLLEKARNYIVEVGGITNAVESFHNDVMRGNNSALNAALGMQLLSELKNDTPASLDILADLCIIATESGRTTQSFSMLKKLGGVGSAYYMKRLESRFNEKYKKQIANGKIGAFKIPDNLMQNLVDAKSAYEIEAAEDAVTKYLGSVMPLSFAERMQNWRYFAMLSKPSTHMRNIIGNALMLTANAGKNVVATGLERAFIPKEQRTHAIYNPANQRDRMAAARLAFTENERDITASGGKYGFDQEVTRNKRKAKLEVLNKAMKANEKALELEDRFFLQIGYVDAYTQYLVAQDIDPANMTRQQKANAHAWAKRQAHDITFRDASKLADMLNSIANKGTVAKVIVDGAIPFKKTPVNVAARAVEYSPLGLSKTIYKFTKGIKDGTSTPADAIDHLSRNITGTVAFCTLGYFLSKLGVLRGIGDEEEKVEDFKAATGERNYSFNVTIDGKNYAIDASGIAPMNIPLFMGAAFYEATEGSGEDFTFSDFVALATEVTNPLMEMSFLSSLDSVLSSYSSEGFGGNIGGMVWQSVKNYGSQYIPSSVAGIASAVDPIQRSTVGDPTQFLGRAEDRYAKSIINRIPFLSKTLEPKVDIHGEIDTASFRTEFGKWALEFANNMILPARITVKNRNSVDEALIRMYEETGRTDIFPAVPENNAFQHKDEKYQMNASQFTDYSVELGNETYAAIKAAMSSSYWDDLTDVARADLIADTIDETKEKMRVKYLDILGAYDK